MKSVYLMSTGTELLQGTTRDSNSIYLASRLRDLGITVIGKVTVGDDRQQLRRAFELGLAAADIVISTGGLGPTFDDLTKQVACELMDCPLQSRPEEEQHLRNYFASRQRPMPSINLRQALFPAEAEVLANLVGTAPGMYLRKNGKLIILLPGPPREMESMFVQAVEPLLKKDFAADLPKLINRNIRTLGLSESQVEEKLGSLLNCPEGRSVALLAAEGEVHIRLTLEATEMNAGRHTLEELTEQIKERLGRNVIGCDDETLVAKVARLLRDRYKILASAESCTGGLLGKMITDLPGSSEYYWGGVVSYSNQAKERLLGVPRNILREFGAVSAETAQAMALGMRQVSNADFSLAITGIAGPGGGSLAKPVGLVYIALAHADSCEVRELRFGPSREYIRILAAKSALDLLRRHLQYS